MSTRSRRNRRVRFTVVLLVLTSIFGIAFAWVLHSFFSDAQTETRGFTTGIGLASVDSLQKTEQGLPNANGVLISGTVISIDPDLRTMSIRLDFTPNGTYASPSGDLQVAHPLRLVVANSVDSGTGGQSSASERQFVDGHVMDTQLVTVALVGEITNYPYDEYSADFSANLWTGSADTPEAMRQQIPTETQLHVVKNGFKITPIKYGNGSDNFISLQVDRADSSRFFATFIMVLMWCIALAAVAIALVLTRLGEDIGPGVLGFLGALLFALPGIRGVLPGAPPVGSLNDYLSFFWAEALVAVTLVVLATVFLVREWQKSHR